MLKPNIIQVFLKKFTLKPPEVQTGLITKIVVEYFRFFRIVMSYVMVGLNWGDGTVIRIAK
jgi:hypothetical protein